MYSARYAPSVENGEYRGGGGGDGKKRGEKFENEVVLFTSYNFCSTHFSKELNIAGVRKRERGREKKNGKDKFLAFSLVCEFLFLLHFSKNLICKEALRYDTTTIKEI